MSRDTQTTVLFKLREPQLGKQCFYSWFSICFIDLDWSKVMKQMKLFVENQDFKKEKDEYRAEMRRLQALKENDMEAYNQLVQETKNSRLKFLLSQTDTYINTINQLIKDQRINDNLTVPLPPALPEGGIPNPAMLIGDMSSGKITKVTDILKIYKIFIFCCDLSYVITRTYCHYYSYAGIE